MDIEERNGTAVFQVRVTPRAGRDAIEGEYQGSLKVRLIAPPVDDKANEALRRLLAASLNVPVSAVRIIAGKKESHQAYGHRRRKWRSARGAHARRERR